MTTKESNRVNIDSSAEKPWHKEQGMLIRASLPEVMHLSSEYCDSEDEEFIDTRLQVIDVESSVDVSNEQVFPEDDVSKQLSEQPSSVDDEAAGSKIFEQVCIS